MASFAGFAISDGGRAHARNLPDENGLTNILLLMKTSVESEPFSKGE